MRPITHFLLLVVACTGLPAAAQRKKAPYISNAFEPIVPVVDAAIRRAGIRSYRELTLSANDSGGLDTSIETTFRLDTRGRLQEHVRYIYNTPPQRLPGARRFEGYSPELRAAVKTTYKYDEAGNGNIVAIVQDAGLMGNTNEVLVAQLRMHLRRSRPEKGQEAAINGPATEAALNRFIDSLRLATPTDPWLQVREQRLTYDEAGNILSIREPGIPCPISFRYGYDDWGRVTLKRMLECATTDSNESASHPTLEIRYAYTDGDKPDSICMYRKSRRSTGIRGEAQLAVCRRFHYNAEGEVDTMHFRTPDRQETQLSTYRGRLRTAIVLLDNGRDTTSYTTFTYGADSLPALERTIELRRGIRRVETVTAYRYEARRMPVEKIVRTMDRLHPSFNTVTLTLYFYGEPAADAQTAARKDVLERELRKDAETHRRYRHQY